MAPFDAIPQAFSTAAPQLTTPLARMLYIRDTIIPAIPEHHINMDVVSCGAYACLAGWCWRDDAFRTAAENAGITAADKFFGWRLIGSIVVQQEDGYNTAIFNALEFLDISINQSKHLFHPESYPLGEAEWLQNPTGFVNVWPATKLELIEHINDVLNGRVR